MFKYLRFLWLNKKLKKQGYEYAQIEACKKLAKLGDERAIDTLKEIPRTWGIKLYQEACASRVLLGDNEALQYLMEDLISDDDLTCYNAGSVLGHLNQKGLLSRIDRDEAIILLISTLGNYHQRCWEDLAYDGLKLLDEEQLADVIYAIVGEYYITDEAIKALIDFYREDQRPLIPIIRYVCTDPEFNYNIWRMLNKLPTLTNKNVIKYLVESLKDAECRTKDEIYDLLITIDDDKFGALEFKQEILDVLVSRLGDYRNHKVYILLGKLRNERAIEPLIKYLSTNSESNESYEAAFDALVKCGEKQLGEMLLEVMHSDTIQDVQKWMDSIPLDKRSPVSSILSEMLENVRHDLSPSKNINICYLLGKLKDRTAIAPLMQFIQKLADQLAVQHNFEEVAPISGAACEALGDLITEQDEEAINLLIKKLKSWQPKVILPACRTLGRLKIKHALQPLISCLQEHEKHLEIRKAACNALGMLGEKEALQPLITYLLKYEENPEIRAEIDEMVCKALGMLGEKEAIPYLKKYLVGDADVNVRLAAARALKLLGHNKVIRELIPCLGSSNPEKCERSAIILGELDEEKLSSAFLKLIKSEETASNDIITLVQAGDERLIEPLLECLHSQSHDIRRVACITLGALKEQRAMEPLIKMLNNRGYDCQCYFGYGHGHYQYYYDFGHYCVDYDQALDQEIFNALVEIGGKQLIGEFISVLTLSLYGSHGKKTCLRQPAAKALAKLGKENPNTRKNIVDKLISLLADKQEREAAAGALEYLGEGLLANTVLGILNKQQESLENCKVMVAEWDMRAVEPLIKSLDSHSSFSPLICTALAIFGDRRAVRPLIRYLIHVILDKEACEKVCEALVRLGDSFAIKPLIYHVCSNICNLPMRDESAYEPIDALNQFGNYFINLTVDAFIEYCSNRYIRRVHPEIVFQAFLGKTAIKNLIEYLGDKDKKDEVIFILQQFGEKDITLAMSAIWDRDREAVFSQLNALIKHGDYRVISPLIRCLYHPYTSKIAQDGLAFFINACADVDTLVKLLDYEKFDEVYKNKKIYGHIEKAHIVNRLVTISEESAKENTKVVEQLIPLLGEHSPKVTEAAYAAIIKLTKEDSQDRLLAVAIVDLLSGDEKLEEEAFNMLRNCVMKGDKRAYKPLLLNLNNPQAIKALKLFFKEEAIIYLAEYLSESSWHEIPNHIYEASENFNDIRIVKALLKNLLRDLVTSPPIHRQDIAEYAENPFTTEEGLENALWREWQHSFFVGVPHSYTPLEKLEKGELAKTLSEVFFGTPKEKKAGLENLKNLPKSEALFLANFFIENLSMCCYHQEHFIQVRNILEQLGETTFTNTKALWGYKAVDQLVKLVTEGDFLIVDQLVKLVKEGNFLIIEPLINICQKHHLDTAQEAFDLIYSTIEPIQSWLLCPECFTRFDTITIVNNEIPRRDFGGRNKEQDETYYYIQIYEHIKVFCCRSCRKYNALLNIKHVVCVLDNDESIEHILEDGILSVNGLQRDNLFDFDRVEIRDANEEQIEGFLLQLKNDNDIFRKYRYDKMNCIIKRDKPLSDSIKDSLRKTFHKVIELKRVTNEHEEDNK